MTRSSVVGFWLAYLAIVAVLVLIALEFNGAAQNLVRAMGG